MKRILVGLCFLLVLSSLCFSMSFSLKLKGGVSLISSGDYNDAIEGRNAYIASFGNDISGTFSKLSLAMDFGGEFIVNVTDQFGIGVGGGYIQASRAMETVSYNYLFIIFTIDAAYGFKPTLTAIPLTLNFHYTPSFGGVKLDLWAGPGLYFCKMKIEGSEQDALLIFPFTDTFTFEGSKTVFGFQGGIGLEIPIGGNISFVVDVTGRYARMSDIQGNFNLTGELVGIPVTINATDYFYYSYTFTPGSTAFPLQTWVNDANAPSGTHVSSVRHGNFDFTGVSGQAGFKITF